MHFKLPKHEKSGEPLLVLFDGMALAYRAYFAFIARPLTNARGENTSAVYGFTMALLQFLEHHAPQFAAVCFDTPKPTFRHEKYKEYKANRQAMPEDLIPQLQVIKDIVKAYNIALIEVDGFEADDIIGTLARRAEREAIDTLIVTPDKDFCQLVTPKIKLLRPAKEGREMEIMDEAGVRTKYGLEPNQIIDYLALVGDASDNIPGVRGIGEKTAAPLISQYGSLTGIYENIATLDKKSVKEKLINDRENATLSYELATIDINVPLPFELATLAYGDGVDYDKLQSLFIDQGFKGLLARIDREQKQSEGVGAPDGAVELLDTELPRDEETELQRFDFMLSNEGSDITSTPHAYVVVKTEEGLKALVTKLRQVLEIAVDLETTSIDSNIAEIIGVSFSERPGEAYYVPIALPYHEPKESESLFTNAQQTDAAHVNSENAFTTGLDAATAIEIMRSLLEDPSVKKIGQNIKYDALTLRHYNIRLQSISFDTMIAGYVLHSDGSHGMDALAQEYLKYRPVPLLALTGPMRSDTVRTTMGLLSTTKLAEYGAEDADVTLKLKLAMEPLLQQESLIRLVEDIDFPLVDVLTTIEFNGVKIDSDLLRIASKEMEREAENVRLKIHEYAGGPFNIDSPKQLADVLFNKLKLTAGRKTKTGLSTNAFVLEELRNDHPIAEHILNYRQYQKLRSTYVDALPLLVNSKTGMVHTNYNQAVVATGRISSTNPNLQNIPIRTELGRDIRKAFVSRFQNGKIFSADYSQIELRIMAHVTKDKQLMEAFVRHEDIHTTTAAGVFGVPVEEVNRDMRRKAKEVNYGIMYGIGAFGLARRLGIPQKEGAEIIQKYFTAFPSIKTYMDDTLTFARQHGYVQTLNGRRRYMKAINASNHAVRSADERAAINMPIQGTAAEMIKLAMIKIQRELESRKMKSLMIMQVHDELVFDVVPEEFEILPELVKRLMESAMPMDVIIEVEAGLGDSWFDAH
jgi:DNA polymerase-1